LLSAADGAIAGVRVKTLDGVERVARARLYVVCCGGIHTPRLLLLSRSERWPDGVGNAYDRVGRGFNEHPSLNFYGRVRPDRLTLSPKHAIGRTHQFYDALREEGLGAIHAVVIQSWVFPNHLLRYRLADVPRHFFKIVSRAVRPTLYMSPTLEMKPIDTNRVTLSRDRRDPLGDPIARLDLDFCEEDRRLLKRSRELVLDTLRRAGATDIDEIEQTWSRHHIGACRMGENPRASVVDGNLQVHGCPNLFLCGAEVFTTGGAVQPVLTIAALAHRLGDHLPRVLSRQRVQVQPVVGAR
jgi:choline dehydrogenase-like flavoprotein